MDRDHELAETRKEIAAVRKALTVAVAELSEKNRRSLIGNVVVAGLLVLVATVGAVGFWDDRNDDRREADREEAEEREECELSNEFRAGTRESLTAFTDALVAAADEADPAQVEAFRRDLQARLAELIPDRLCDAERRARELGRPLAPAELQPLE